MSLFLQLKRQSPFWYGVFTLWLSDFLSFFSIHSTIRKAHAHRIAFGFNWQAKSNRRGFEITLAFDECAITDDTLATADEISSFISQWSTDRFTGIPAYTYDG